VSANATPVGRARSAPCDTTNAKYPTATATVIAPTANATVYVATRGSTARKSIVHIRLAQVTVSALRVHASVKRAGKVPIAVKWIRRHCNVCRTAAAMGISIWRLRPASANPCGPVMIVRKVSERINMNLFIFYKIIIHRARNTML